MKKLLRSVSSDPLIDVFIRPEKKNNITHSCGTTNRPCGVTGPVWLVNMNLLHHNAKLSHLCNPNWHSINRQFFDCSRWHRMNVIPGKVGVSKPKVGKILQTMYKKKKKQEAERVPLAVWRSSSDGEQQEYVKPCPHWLSCVSVRSCRLPEDGYRTVALQVLQHFHCL